ncbi:MAG: N-acetylmuramoyl-L-alanine amidase [Candidatus Hydrogenedentes bacterium]|nr:N-acetylmuramoyl-L-alanine amidase [Candidatus Hydrogenedentota bacterium]
MQYNHNIVLAIVLLFLGCTTAAYADVAYYEATVQEERIALSAAILYAQEIPYISLGDLLHQLGGSLQITPAKCLINYRGITVILKPDTVAITAPGISFSLLHPARVHEQGLYLAQTDIADFFSHTYKIHVVKVEAESAVPAPSSSETPALDEDTGSLLEVLPLPSPGDNEPEIIETGKAAGKKEDEYVTENISPPESTSENAEFLSLDNIIILDPGHGGQDVGATAGNTLLEKDISLSLLLKLRNILKETTSLTLHLTRDSDKNMPLSTRGKTADAGDLLISIHTGYSTAASAHGITLFTDQLPSPPKSNAAEKIRRQYNKRRTCGEKAATITYRIAHVLAEENLPGPITVRTAPLIIQRLSTVPCILIELAYLNNPDITNLITENEYQTHIAEILAHAISVALSHNTNS